VRNPAIKGDFTDGKVYTEHFSTPLFFARDQGFFQNRSLDVQLVPYPSGTGAMTKALEAGALDAAVGLTEGWIAALGNGADAFKLVGKYVDTPLCWAISTGGQRADMASSDDLAGGKKKLGISRFGSGSYVMGYVLADQEGWLKEGEEPFDWTVLDNFKNLRDAVNREHPEGKEADAFMWEHFTSK
jgi:ABC-type nitrate/sulfonate/bicarbonate transport system substrate-binding protein